MNPVQSGATAATSSTTTLPSERPSLEPGAIADALLRHSSTPQGVDLTQLRAGVRTIGDVSPTIATATQAVLQARLSPVEAGELSSDGPGFFPFPFSLDFFRYVAAAIAQNQGATFAQDLFGTRSPADAPPSVTFPEGLNERFQTQMNNSLPGGYADEQGGTLTYDKGFGTLGLANPEGAFDFGGGGSFTPDRDLSNPDTFGVLGAFHTHPYSEAEGGFTGVSFSGGDVATMLAQGDTMAVVQSGDRQFMLVRTAQTPANVDHQAIANQIDDRSAQLQRQGVDFVTANNQAVEEAAQRLGLAYYEGSNGTLNRVA